MRKMNEDQLSIYSTICNVLKISDEVSIITSKNQSTRYKLARMFWFHFYKSDFSLAALGSYFFKDHATVMNSLTQYENLEFSGDALFLNVKKQLTEKLNEKKILNVKKGDINKDYFISAGGIYNKKENK